MLNKYFKLIEDAIKGLGIDIDSTKTDLPNKWYLHRGNADIVLYFRETQLASGALQYGLTIVSTIIAVPTETTDKIRLYERLLDLNHYFPHERFSMHSGVVYLCTLVDLDEHTAVDVIKTRVLNYSTYAAGFVEELRAVVGEV